MKAWVEHPDSKVHGANMGPTWVLSTPDRPHVGPLNLAIRAAQCRIWVVKRWAPWGSSNCWPHSYCVHDLIHKALSKMKYDKAAGLSGIIAEMLKAAGEEGVELVRKLTEAIFGCGVIPSDRGRTSYWTSIKARMKPLPAATIVVASSKIKPWSWWNGY